MTPEARKGGRLRLDAATKRYGDQVVLDQVSLDVKPGEFLTLLGPSGSGKTTTLNLIAGFLHADGGGIELDGRDLSNVPAHSRDIGVVFQQYALFPHLTAAQNVGFPLDVRKVKGEEKKARVQAALDMVRLGDYGDRLPSQLSGGQQQRIALARAFVFQPRLLLMDEPLGALDKKLREVLQIEITKICRELGVTVIYVTHDQEEALVMSDRIAIYNSGRIEQIGSAEDLYERPASLFVADFVGESNVIPGTLDGRDALKCPAGTLRLPPGGPARPAQSDASAAIVLRPERARIAHSSRSLPDGVNCTTGTLSELVYLGLARKCIVTTDQGTELVVRSDVKEEFEDDLRPGDPVSVWWHPHDSVVVPAPAAG
jgi:putative spermidine/putrescine transport system ATP-binding protein